MHIFSIILIVSGAILIATCLFLSLKSYSFLKELDNQQAKKLLRYHNLHHLLMVFFLFGYLVVAFAMVKNVGTLSEFGVGIIFFFGAVFILLGIQLQAAMNMMLRTRYEIADKAVNALKDERVELLKANNALEIEVSERKKAEAITKESQFRLQQILHNIPIGILVIEAESLQVVEVNPMGEQIIGTNATNILGQLCHNYICPAEKGACPMHQPGMKFNQGEHVIHTDDGREIPILKTVSRIELNGKVHFLEAFFDITEKKQLQEQLDRSQKMEILGILAGEVAHDLNNILSGLINYPELILMKVEENSPLKKPLETIKKSGQKAAAIVQDLLDLARQGVLAKEDTSLASIIRDYQLAPEYEQLCKRHPNVSIQFYDKGIDDLIPASPIHLSKVVMNLITNAVEAIQNEGEVSISLHRRNLTESFQGYETIPSGEFIVLTVQDNGEGIGAEDITSIFEPFYTSKKMGHSGSGLGMSVVWNTIKNHDGYIHIKSTKGLGTTIDLYFPVSTKSISEPKDSDEKMAIPKGEGQSILVVDDVELQREIASSMLTHIGYSVDTVHCGERAIEIIEEKSFDLVLLDMIMEPGMDGLETYRQLQKINPNLPVILVSGFADSLRVDEMKTLGLSSTINKPYTLFDMATCIAEVLQRVNN